MGKKKATGKKYAPGTNPQSLANLTYHEGRKCDFKTPKKQHTITVTDEAWTRLKSLAAETGCASVSDLLEKITRGIVEIPAA